VPTVAANAMPANTLAITFREESFTSFPPFLAADFGALPDA
jgi:hypothetical protein